MLITSGTDCDSVGLASVLDMICRGVDVRVVGSRPVARTIALTGTTSEVPLFDSVSDAIRGHSG